MVFLPHEALDVQRNEGPLFVSDGCALLGHDTVGTVKQYTGCVDNSEFIFPCRPRMLRQRFEILRRTQYFVSFRTWPRLGRPSLL